MKKNEIMTFAGNQMELEMMIASKIRQTEEGRCDMLNLGKKTQK